MSERAIIDALGPARHSPRDFRSAPNGVALLSISRSMPWASRQGDRLLRIQSQSEPGRADPSRQPNPFGDEPRPKGCLDGWPLSGQRLARVTLPTGDRRIAAPEQIRQGSLSQPEIHPLPSNLMTPRISIVRSPGSNAPSESVGTWLPQR